MWRTYAYTSSDAYSYPYPCASNCDSLSHVYTISYPYSSAHSNPDATAHGHGVPYVYSVSHSHPIAYIHSYPSAHAYGVPHVYSLSDSHPIAYIHSNSGAHANCNLNGRPHSYASPNTDAVCYALSYLGIRDTTSQAQRSPY
ncbi:MAG: hypothetical protein ABID84_01765 [Chloroflexota bacterium]